MLICASVSRDRSGQAADSSVSARPVGDCHKPCSQAFSSSAAESGRIIEWLSACIAKVGLSLTDRIQAFVDLFFAPAGQKATHNKDNVLCCGSSATANYPGSVKV